jgi:hypothetical protein
MRKNVPQLPAHISLVIGLPRRDRWMHDEPGMPKHLKMLKQMEQFVSKLVDVKYGMDDTWEGDLFDLLAGELVVTIPKPGAIIPDLEQIESVVCGKLHIMSNSVLESRTASIVYHTIPFLWGSEVVGLVE